MWDGPKKCRLRKHAREAGEDPCQALSELAPVMETVKKAGYALDNENTGIGSTIFAVKPETVPPASRPLPVRKYWAAGQILPMSMPPRGIAPI